MSFVKQKRSAIDTGFSDFHKGKLFGPITARNWVLLAVRASVRLLPYSVRVGLALRSTPRFSNDNGTSRVNYLRLQIPSGTTPSPRRYVLFSLYRSQCHAGVQHDPVTTSADHNKQRSVELPGRARLKPQESPVRPSAALPSAQQSSDNRGGMTKEPRELYYCYVILKKYILCISSSFVLHITKLKQKWFRLNLMRIFILDRPPRRPKSAALSEQLLTRSLDAHQFLAQSPMRGLVRVLENNKTNLTYEKWRQFVCRIFCRFNMGRIWQTVEYTKN